MRFFTMRGPRRPSRACASLLSLGALSAVLLSGCGGGGINGTSSSDQGFRIVPAGGTVVPTFTDDGTPTNLTINAQPNAVSQGVKVDVLHHTLTSSEQTALGSQVGPQVGTTGYQIQLTPQTTTFGAPVQFTITIPATTLSPITSTSQSTIKIYTFDQAVSKWVVLPGTFSSTTNTVTGTLVFPSDSKSLNTLQNAPSDSGVYVVAYDTAPNPPTGI
jgi:hypothetical protein